MIPIASHQYKTSHSSSYFLANSFSFRLCAMYTHVCVRSADRSRKHTHTKQQFPFKSENICASLISLKFCVIYLRLNNTCLLAHTHAHSFSHSLTQSDNFVVGTMTMHTKTEIRKICDCIHCDVCMRMDMDR